MNYVWWAIRDVAADDVIARVLEPAGYVRDPRWTPGSALENVTCACFAMGAWTFAFLPEGTDELDAAIAGLGNHEVIKLHRADTDEWATVLGIRAGVDEWSVSGAAEDDRLRITGSLPATPPKISAKLDELVARDSELDRVPREIACLLTGFMLDENFDFEDREASLPTHVVRLAKEPPTLELEMLPERAPQISTRAPSAPTAFAVADLVVTESDGADGDPWRGFTVLARTPDRVLVSTMTDHFYEIDITVFPPTFRALGDERCDTAMLAPWGTTLAANIDGDANTIVREIDGARSRLFSLPFATLHALHVVGDGVLALPVPGSNGDPVPYLIGAEPDGRRTFTRIAVPPLAEGKADPFAIGLGDGSFLLSWGTASYRCTATSIEKRAPLRGKLGVDAMMAAPDGSVLCLLADKLVRVQPTGAIDPITDVPTPRRLLAGPEDTVFLVASRDDADLRVWWRTSGHIAVVPLALEEDIELAYFDHRRDQLVVIATQVYAIPWRAIAART